MISSGRRNALRDNLRAVDHSEVARCGSEVKWNGPRKIYRAWLAEKSATRRGRWPKSTKLAAGTRLRREGSGAWGSLVSARDRPSVMREPGPV